MGYKKKRTKQILAGTTAEEEFVPVNFGWVEVIRIFSCMITKEQKLCVVKSSYKRLFIFGIYTPFSFGKKRLESFYEGQDSKIPTF